ncbi:MULTISPECIES: fructose-specific PTS transporter subunit EIIC [unclassified Spiroplasma]|uniref:PTS fructose transporter subunit IIABC n=1 Tax=unclassified Spiroplasma TaxID=2637901 RepID=UPI00313ED0F4
MNKNLLKLNNIVFNLDVNSQDDVFNEIARLAAKNNIINSQDNTILITALKAREALTSTGMGAGLAIPHAQDDVIKKPAVMFLRFKQKMDWKAIDDQPVQMAIVLLVPKIQASDLHLNILSSIAQRLLDEKVKEILTNSLSKEEIINALFCEEANEPKIVSKPTNILAITACPVGVAHTYIAADKLKQAAKKLDYGINVETHGAAGVKNSFTNEDIANADAVLIASDIGVDLSRFANKKILQVKVSQAIKNPEQLLIDALNSNKVLSAINFSTKNKQNNSSILKHFMTGVSYMVPFVILGGILVALSISLAKIITGNNNATPNDIEFLKYLNIIGASAMYLMIPILGGFIAYSIAGRAALVPAMVASLIGNEGNNFFKFFKVNIIDSVTNKPIDMVPMGFVGALIAGLVAGYLVKWINSWKVPQSLSAAIPIFVIPILVGGLLSLTFIFVIGAPISYVMTWVQYGLSWVYGNQNIGLGIAFAMGLLIGAMAGFDIGGPINKVAFFTASTLVTMKIYQPMGTIAAAIPVAPLGMGLSTIIFRKYFDAESRQAGIASLIMGTIGISEGAIPFAIRDPKRAIIANVIGSSIAGGLAGIFSIQNYAQHGGPIMAFLGAVPYGSQTAIFLIIIAVGTLITCFSYGLLLMIKNNELNLKKYNFMKYTTWFKRGK